MPPPGHRGEVGQGGDDRAQRQDPRATAKALGLTYQPWMDNLRSKDLHNGALVAMDYQTGELVAYVGSADPNAQQGDEEVPAPLRRPRGRLAPARVGVQARRLLDRHRQQEHHRGLDVHGRRDRLRGGYTPTDADNLERGPVRMRDALMFSLNIPAVKAGAVIGNDAIQAQAEAMGIQFQDGQVNAGMSFPLGVEVVHPLDLSAPTACSATGGRLADQTTIIAVTDSNGKVLVDETTRARARAGRSTRAPPTS